MKFKRFHHLYKKSNPKMKAHAPGNYGFIQGYLYQESFL
jgi:hypothetical protein